jgi:OmpA-OmpF porin, OOP family
LKSTSEPALEEITKLLSAQQKLNLWVVGHTDNVGKSEYNRKLSLMRAEAVVDALVKRFKVKPGRMSAAGVGLLAPIANNSTEAGRALNRRVELIER